MAAEEEEHRRLLCGKSTEEEEEVTAMANDNVLFLDPICRPAKDFVCDLCGVALSTASNSGAILKSRTRAPLVVCAAFSKNAFILCDECTEMFVRDVMSLSMAEARQKVIDGAFDSDIERISAIVERSLTLIPRGSNVARHRQTIRDLCISTDLGGIISKRVGVLVMMFHEIPLLHSVIESYAIDKKRGLSAPEVGQLLSVDTEFKLWQDMKHRGISAGYELYLYFTPKKDASRCAPSWQPSKLQDRKIATACWNPQCQSGSYDLPDTFHVKRCSGCGVAVYCSNRCQKTHWNTHKPACQHVQLEFVDHEKIDKTKT